MFFEKYLLIKYKLNNKKKGGAERAAMNYMKWVIKTIAFICNFAVKKIIIALCTFIS